MRNARVTECGVLAATSRFDKAVAEGLGEEVVDDITDGYETLGAADRCGKGGAQIHRRADPRIPNWLTGDASRRASGGT